MTSSMLNLKIPYRRTNQGKSYFFFMIQISLAKLCIPSEATLRHIFLRQLFRTCTLSLDGKIAPNDTVRHEFDSAANMSLVRSTLEP